MNKTLIALALGLCLTACQHKDKGPYEFECKDTTTDVVVYNVPHVTLVYTHQGSSAVWSIEQENGHVESFNQPTGWTCYWQAVR